MEDEAPFFTRGALLNVLRASPVPRAKALLDTAATLQTPQLLDATWSLLSPAVHRHVSARRDIQRLQELQSQLYKRLDLEDLTVKEILCNAYNLSKIDAYWSNVIKELRFLVNVTVCVEPTRVKGDDGVTDVADVSVDDIKFSITPEEWGSKVRFHPDVTRGVYGYTKDDMGLFMELEIHEMKPQEALGSTFSTDIYDVATGSQVDWVSTIAQCDASTAFFDDQTLMMIVAQILERFKTRSLTLDETGETETEEEMLS